MRRYILYIKEEDDDDDDKGIVDLEFNFLLPRPFWGNWTTTTNQPTRQAVQIGLNDDDRRGIILWWWALGDFPLTGDHHPAADEASALLIKYGRSNQQLVRRRVGVWHRQMHKVWMEPEMISGMLQQRSEVNEILLRLIILSTGNINCEVLIRMYLVLLLPDYISDWYQVEWLSSSSPTADI